MHDLTADLPPPHDDEPASLRQDIIDEITDHLECATRRELLAGGGRQSPQGSNPEHAFERALTRFGNPAAIARKLWLDAMQEKLMAQKITILLATVATAAVVFLSFVVWQTLERATDAQRLANDAQLALIARLQSLETAAPAANYEWCQFRVRLTEDTHDGPPAVGMKVALQKISRGGSSDASTATNNSISYPFHELESDEQGIVDFSPVPYGPYHLSVKMPSGHLMKTDIAVRAGHDVDLTITCPVSPPESQVTLRLNLDDVTASDDVRERLWMLCRVYQPNNFVYGSVMPDEKTQPGTIIDDNRWVLWETREVLVSQDGTMYEVDWPVHDVEEQQSDGFGNPRTIRVPTLDQTYELQVPPASLESIRLPVGRYAVDYELVLMSKQSTDEELSWSLIDEGDPVIELANWVAPAAWWKGVQYDNTAELDGQWGIEARENAVGPEENVRYPSPALDHQLISPSEPEPINLTGGDGGPGGSGGGFF